MYFHIENNIKTLKLFTILIALLLIITSFSVIYIVRAANSFVEYDSAWSLGDCYIQVYNRRTGKYTVGAFNRDWENNVTTTNVLIGDTIEVDVCYLYNGGKFWKYEDGILSTQWQDDGSTLGHYYHTFVVSVNTTKVSCSASANASQGEQLSVTLVAKTDFVAPTVTVSANTVEANKPIRFTLTDDVGVVAYAVTDTSSKPTSGWTGIVSTTSTLLTYTPRETKRYYVWAKDAYGNISDYGNTTYFDCGIKPQVSVESQIDVMEDHSATVVCNVTKGTAPLSYQWYYKDSSSHEIPGATSSTYIIDNARKAMNGRKYYCEVSNPIGSTSSSDITLNVYYPPTLKTLPDANVKKGQNGQTYTYTAEILTDGNPDTYTYQWYKSQTDAGDGTLISGARGASYPLNPSQDVIEWYWCIVSNEQYSVSTNRSRAVIDVNEPKVKLGDVNTTVPMKSADTIQIPLIVEEAGEGYQETVGTSTTNFQASEIQVLVGGEIKTGITKTIEYKNHSGKNYNYLLTLKNVPGDGELSLRIDNGAIVDYIGNVSEEKTLNTGIIIDNTLPTVEFDKVISGVTDNYANVERKIVLSVKVIEKNALEDTRIFSSEDIKVLVSGAEDTGARITVDHNEKGDGYSLYTVSITNVSDDGTLQLLIPENSIYDKAFNYNTNITVNTPVIIDNTNPTISVNAISGGVAYPGGLADWHEGWTNQDITITITANDVGGIDFYAKQKSTETNYTKLTSNQDAYTTDFEDNVTYIAYDKAGNRAEVVKNIKIDKTKPLPTVVALYEDKIGGGYYKFNPSFPTTKNIFFDAYEPNDAGEVKSGISYNHSYYTLDTYTGIDGETQVGTTVTYSFSENVVNPGLTTDGYYVIKSYTMDLAGNLSEGGPYEVYISKMVDNTIRLSNIRDIGSGVERVTINIYRDGSSDILKQIIKENPGNEILESVRLGKGTYHIDVIIEDRAVKYDNPNTHANIKTLPRKTITNKF